jgi:hypothetical protein
MDRSTGKSVGRLVGMVVVVGAALALSVAIASATVSVPGWMQSNASGFGQPENFSIGALDTFGNQLYAGTWNDSGAQVWRTADGQAWNQVTPTWNPSNTVVYDMAPFGSYLYVGTVGNEAEIWRTDGTTWGQVVSGGLMDADNIGISALAEFGGDLYAATANLPPAGGGTGHGVEVWRSPNGNAGSWVQVNADGFGSPTWQDVTMDVYQGHLYVGLGRVTGGGALAELWRSGNGTTWTPVFTDGLGYAGNSHVSAMAEFQGDFYIGLRNTTNGGQVWRSANGVDFTPVFTDGLGEVARGRTYGLIVYEGRLVVVFGKMATGAEVWQSADGLTWQPIATGGWGNGNNVLAGSFDKAVAIFRDGLYIGTANFADGGQIWRRLRVAYLPVVLRSH